MHCLRSLFLISAPWKSGFAFPPPTPIFISPFLVRRVKNLHLTQEFQLTHNVFISFLSSKQNWALNCYIHWHYYFVKTTSVWSTALYSGLTRQWIYLFKEDDTAWLARTVYRTANDCISVLSWYLSHGFYLFLNNTLANTIVKLLVSLIINLNGASRSKATAASQDKAIFQDFQEWIPSRW